MIKGCFKSNYRRNKTVEATKVIYDKECYIYQLALGKEI